MKTSEWQLPTSQLQLGEEVHIWRIPLAASNIEKLRTVLSLPEQQRAERFHFDRHRRRFIVAHAALRQILGSYLGISPSALDFCHNEHGKPDLVPELQSRLRFNLSHSHGLALVALADGKEIGVDVEQIRDGVMDQEIAGRFFSAAEVEQLRRFPEYLRKKAFFLCWTRKEAYIKARGQGLSIPLDSFEVTLVDPPSLRPEPEQRHCHWQLHNIPIDYGYAAAFVVRGCVACTRQWQWTNLGD